MKKRFQSSIAVMDLKRTMQTRSSRARIQIRSTNNFCFSSDNSFTESSRFRWERFFFTWLTRTGSAAHFLYSNLCFLFTSILSSLFTSTISYLSSTFSIGLPSIYNNSDFFIPAGHHDLCFSRMRAEQLTHQFRLIIVLAQVGEDQMAQLFAPVFREELQRGCIAQVTMIAADAAFEVKRIIAVREHRIAVIAFPGKTA